MRSSRTRFLFFAYPDPLCFLYILFYISYKEEQREKKKILDRLLREYDDGQKVVFFCLAVNMLEVADLKDVLKQAEKATEAVSQSEKAEFMELII